MSQTIEIDTLVAGAGPQALTLLARWVCDQPTKISNVVAADPAGSWMHRWDRQFEQQQIEVLRSPGVHHPDPDEMALIHTHQYHKPNAIENMALRGPLRRPARADFARFCQHLAERTGLNQRVLPASVVNLIPLATASQWAATLSDDTTVHCRQVVWASNPRTPKVPQGFQLCDTVFHSSQVDTTSVAPGQQIAVFGGGQTAGQLARSSAEVLLVSRGPQRIVDLDVDAGWLMDDHLIPFRSIKDPSERRQVVEDTLRGSMTDLVDSLQQASVRQFSNVGDISAWPANNGKATIAFSGAQLHVDQVWVATGAAPRFICRTSSCATSTQRSASYRRLADSG